jgi:hypothetical protein
MAGQLVVRDGMAPVVFSTASPAGCLDVAGYTYGGSAKVLAFTSDGQLQVLDTPSYGEPLGEPFVPDLSYDGDQIHVGYDYRYNEHGDELPDPPSVCFQGIHGGYPVTTRWNACVQATCSSGITEWSGGSPATTSFACSLHEGIELCPCVAGAP